MSHNVCTFSFEMHSAIFGACRKLGAASGGQGKLLLFSTLT